VADTSRTRSGLQGWIPGSDEGGPCVRRRAPDDENFEKTEAGRWSPAGFEPLNLVTACSGASSCAVRSCCSSCW